VIVAIALMPAAGAAGGTGGGEPAAQQAAGKGVRTVLLLHSYHAGYEWTDNLDRGIRTAFEDSPHAVELRSEYLDLKRFTSSGYTAEVARHLAAKYAGVRFDVVLSTDDGALEFLAHHRARLFPDTAVVFCGVNDASAVRFVPRGAFTGVLEVFSDTGILDLALRLHPDRRRVVVVGDNSPVGEATLRQFREVAAQRRDVSFEFLDGRQIPLDDIVAALSRRGAGDIVITSAFARDRDGTYLALDQANRQIAAAADVPVYSPSISRLGQGVLGGSQSTGIHHGTIAAGLVNRILGGTPPSNLPVVEDRKNLWVFDFVEMQRWGVRPADLPPDALIVNRPDDFYARYSGYIWGGAGFIAVQIDLRDAPAPPEPRQRTSSPAGGGPEGGRRNRDHPRGRR
jgi:hypothetical protein